MSEDLPEGWAEARLADVVRRVPNTKPETEPTREFAYVDISAVDRERNEIVGSGVRRFCGKDAPSRARRPIEAGDVLFSNVRTNLRNVALVPTPPPAVLCSNGFTVLRSNGAVLQHYLLRWVLTDGFTTAVSETQTGTHYPATTDAQVFEQPIRVAPLAEQHRIVAKVEALLEQVRRAKDRLDRVPLILKRFRQAVLAAACSGQLTEAWRAVAKPSSVKPPEDSVGTDDQDNTESFVENAPGSWVWAAIDDACETVIDYRGRTPPTSDNGKIPHVRTTNVRGGRIDWNTEGFVTEVIYEQFMTRGIPKLGDVIFTMEAPLGDAAPVDTDRKFSLAQRLLLLRGQRGLLVGRFLALILQSPQVRRSIEARATGSTVLGIAYKRLKYVRLPIPSMEEQSEIIRIVEALFAYATAIEQRVERAATRASKLPQAVLSKAFAGELVPTEADLARAEARDYETAAQLVARVQRERAEAAPTVKKRPANAVTSAGRTRRARHS